MVRIIGCASGKGGVGKTKTNVGVACALAMGEGKPRVLLVDLCPEQGMLSYMYSPKKDESGIGIGRILQGVRDGLSESWIQTKFTEAKDTLIVSSAQGVTIDFLPAAAEVLGDLSLDGWQETSRGYLLSRFVEAVQDKYDYMIFDTVPLVQIPTTASLMAIADAVVVVLDVQKIANVSGLKRFIDRIKRHGAHVVGVVPNLFDPKLAASKQAKSYVDGICQGAGIPVLEILKRSGTILNADDVFLDEDSGRTMTGLYVCGEADPAGRARIQAAAVQFESIATHLKIACEALEVANG